MGKRNARTHQVDAKEDADDTTPSYPLHYSATSRTITPAVLLNEVETVMEIDTAATLSTMSEHSYNSLWQSDVRPQLKPTTARLSTYTKENIQVLGQITVEQTRRLPLLVVPGDGPTLLGHYWLECIHIDWPKIHQLHTRLDLHVKPVLDRFASVFNGELGDISTVPASLHVESTQTPRFFKARPVSYSLKDKVEAELNRLQESGVISPVTFSEWAAPIVLVVKCDGHIRFCGDYKLTVNAVSQIDTYPPP